MGFLRDGNSTGRFERGRRARTVAVTTAAALLATLCLSPSTASAGLKAVTIAPAAPSTCDSVTIRVEGDLLGSCYTLVDADISGPVPIPEVMGPVPAYGFRIRVIVQEPNPLLDIPCTAELVPYAREFSVGGLAPGIYHVNAVEYLVPWERNSNPVDTSAVSTSFPVTANQECLPPDPCVFLDFRPPPGAPPDRICAAIGRPGGEACLDVALSNAVPVGGAQFEIRRIEIRLITPLGTITPKSVTTTSRTEGFQVAWQADGQLVKALLYSSDGKTIPAGRGPILHVCYGISEDMPDGPFLIKFENVVIADPAGNTIYLCPTFAEVTGLFCIGSRECDVNGDGRSNILDIVQLVRCVLSSPGSEACPDSIATRADCNDDGAVDVRDVICCVRRILDGGGPDAPSGSIPPEAGTNFIGFAGPVRWITPVDGRATIEIAQDEFFAGMQFRLVPNGPVRIRDVSVVEGGPNTAVEWAAGQDGAVRAMLYTPPNVPVPANGAPAVSAPIRLEVRLEPVPGSAGNASVTLADAGSATWAGLTAPTLTTVPTVEAGAPGIAAPSVFPARPNPFVSDTEIAYSLPTASRASLRVYDVRGRLVRVLADAALPAGVHRARWDGRDASGRTVSAGIYFVKLNAGAFERAERLLRLR